MQLLLASSNPHKVEEMRAILEPLGIISAGLDSLASEIDEPVEDGDSFAANARIKARYYAKHTGVMCLADDSGLVVDALGGQPGIFSARFAEHNGIVIAPDADRAARDAANNALLLERIAGIDEAHRTARFVCAMCLADPDGTVLAETRGAFEGIITDKLRGSNGFGYDPLLWLPDVGCTSAELSPADKNARSHRGQAATAMARELARLVAAKR